jgi:pyrimidine-nucleoside phosphorylase/thymidine phosphorylase
MIDVAATFDLRCQAVVSDMSQPLGFAVGNALEVKEALDALTGRYIPGLTELSLTLSCRMVRIAEPEMTEHQAEARVLSALQSGDAYNQFLRWAAAQGADVSYLTSPERLPTATNRIIVSAQQGGWISDVNPRDIGWAALRLGAGRLVQGDLVDYAAGVVLRRRVGDIVRAGEPLAEIHFNSQDPAVALSLVESAFSIANNPTPGRDVVLEVL